MMNPDRPSPVASLLTPPSPSGIAVVALTGTGARELMNEIFHPVRAAKQSLPAVDRARYGHIRHEQRVLDEVLLLRIHEEVPAFEICCHGGAGPATAILDLLARLGAEVRPWSRSIPTGTLIHDLFSALIRSAGQRQAACLAQLYGGVLRDAFLSVVRAHDDLKSLEREKNGKGRTNATTLLDRLEQSYALGRFLHRPPLVVLTGPVNAGKSTLFNALLGEHRALTSPIPGTTRDPVEALMLLNGFPLRLLDLPGDEGAPRNPLDQESQSEAARWVRRADLLLFVTAIGEPGGKPRSGSGRPHDRRKTSKVPPLLHISNKADQDSNYLEFPQDTGNPSKDARSESDRKKPLLVSALKERGLNSLLDHMSRSLNLHSLSDCKQARIINRRQLILVRSTREALASHRFNPRLAARWKHYLNPSLFLA